jgi:hypothetical protein
MEIDFNTMQLDGLLGGTRAEFIGRRETEGPLTLRHHIRQLSVHQKHGEVQVEITVPSGRRRGSQKRLRSTILTRVFWASRSPQVGEAANL